MARQLDSIKRMMLIINKIYASSQPDLGIYISSQELLNYLNNRIDTPITERTLQRDIRDIEILFHIEIAYDRKVNGYVINETYTNKEDRLSEMLINFELMNSLDDNTNMRSYILPEHHRAVRSKYMPQLIYAVRYQHPISFTYTLYRRGGELIKKTNILPHYIKESNQLWYVLAYDTNGTQLKSYGVERIQDLLVHEEHFERLLDVDVKNMFNDCYGIWNDEEKPVEEIILQYDDRDGYFLKAMPLHHSQKILIDDGRIFKISLRLKITNDFVMALLARSRSLEVIAPLHLRERINKIYQTAIERNKL